VLFFFACTLFTDSTESSSTSCQNSAECLSGFSCQENLCTKISCVSSQDCKLQEFCNADNVCIDGCQFDHDCVAGEECIEQQCQEYGCRDPHLDCLLGERCVERECVFVEPNPCSSCTYQDWSTGLGNAQECVIVSYNQTIPCDWALDEGCPGEMSCYPADGLGEVEEGVCIHSYAFFRCSEDVDCPRGFHCKQDIYANDSDVHVCWGDCNYYIEQGWL